MAKLPQIDKSIVENPDFNNPTQDITISITLTDGENLSFIAQKEFFTPRRIATNRGDVALMENVVEYTPANIPVVKMPGVNQDITNPQYYLNSIVSDQYQQLPINKYFLELDNDLATPDYTGSLLEQRDLALNTLLNLQDAAAAARAGDQTAYTAAAAQVDENYAAMAGLQNMQELTPDQLLTPDEADQLAAIGIVGLNATQNSDISADIINPVPQINDSDLIKFGNKISLLTGKTAGTDVINQAIKLLNSGVQAAESASQTGTTDDGKCKFITIAKGKKGGVFGIGAKSYETKVSREDTEKKLALVNADIAAQQASPTLILQTQSGFSPFVKVEKGGFFGKLVSTIANAGILGQIASVIATGGASFALVAAANISAPKGYKPMSKDQALSCLQKTQEQLQSILAKDC